MQYHCVSTLRIWVCKVTAVFCMTHAVVQCPVGLETYWNSHPKYARPWSLLAARENKKNLFNLFENVRTNELGTFAANLFACKSLLTMILAESWHITKWSVDVLSDWLLFFHLFPPGGLGSRRSIGAMLSSVPLLRQSCQEMGQSRPVHVEKDFW